MVKIEKDLWRSSCPIPLLKQEHLEHIAHNHVQTAFEDIQER